MKPWILIGSASLILCGCVKPTVSPVTPGEDAPESWVSAPLTDGERLATTDLAVWWTLFDDDVLIGLVQQSLDANLDLATAAARVEEAFAQVGIASGERWPQVNGTASLFETRLSDASGGASGDRNFAFSSVGFDLSWELDFWGRISKGVESAEASAQASIEDFRGVRAVIAAQVVTGYVRLRELQLRQTLAEENISLQQGTLKLTQGRFDNGLVPKLDVDQAQLNLSRTEAVLPQLRQLEAETRRALEILAGQAPGSLKATLDAPAEVPLPNAANLRDLPANVIRRRPDLRSAEMSLLAAAAVVGVSKAEMYPRISILGTFAWEARDGNSLFSGDSVSYTFGPSIFLPIFQGGRLRSQVDAAEARALQAELSYRQLVLEALGEVENALTAYQEEQIRYGKLEQGVDAAETAVIQVRSLYENGLVTFLNVLDAERNLASIQDEAAASLGLTARNLAEVYRAFGGGWDAPEFEPMPGDVAEEEVTLLSTQTAVLSLLETTDEVYHLKVESYESYHRDEPRASGMVMRVQIGKSGLDAETQTVLDDLLPGERVRLSWEETEVTSEEESFRSQRPVSAQRISVSSK